LEYMKEIFYLCMSAKNVSRIHFRKHLRIAGVEVEEEMRDNLWHIGRQILY